MSFDFAVILQYLPRLFSGLVWTLGMSIAAYAIAITLGLAIALLYGLKSRPLCIVLRIYIEFMRGIPILVVLFLLYYAGPTFGLRLDATLVGIAGLGLYGAAYFAEVFRSGLENIRPGELEAARMLGMNRLQIIRRIEVPQMFSAVMPSLINQLIMLVKESAVLSVITVPELTSVTTKVVTESFRVTEPFLVMAAMYWLLIEALARGGRAIERRLRRYF
jgi:polar amino acid transport system permease protein